RFVDRRLASDRNQFSDRRSGEQLLAQIVYLSKKQSFTNGCFSRRAGELVKWLQLKHPSMMQPAKSGNK
ncbi:MAG TPA: hypothetical protein PLM89_07450, partial [Anaerolineales bacterium]|nr:hypothetical protein [Anaerolineales bacterium]